MMILWLACAEPAPIDTPLPTKTIQDYDEDGFENDVDCNDLDPNIHPDAPEICDQKDNNCDNLIDDQRRLFIKDAVPCSMMKCSRASAAKFW